VIDDDAWLAAWNSADDEQILALCSPDVEVHAVTLSVEGRLYRGHEGIRDWLRDVRQRFRARSEAESIAHVDDDTLIMAGTLYLRSDMGADMVEQSFAMLMKVRDDKARWIGTFANEPEAREALQRGVV
jgi:ketosteroid isomerase-like protein